MIQNTGFTIIYNDIINTGNLSLKALGMYLYIKSKPIGWRFAMNRIKNEVADGVSSIRASLIELEQAELIVRTKTKNEKGQFMTEYVVNEIEFKLSAKKNSVS